MSDYQKALFKLSAAKKLLLKLEAKRAKAAEIYNKVDREHKEATALYNAAEIEFANL